MLLQWLYGIIGEKESRMNKGLTKTILVLNSGSSSEKVSLYMKGKLVCSLYFEGIEREGKRIYICTITRVDGSEEVLNKEWYSLDDAFKEARAIFENGGYISDERPLDAIAVRVVAAGRYFSKHHFIRTDGDCDEVMRELTKVETINMLHVPGTRRGILNAREAFPGVAVVVVSDSNAVATESRRDLDYALPKEIAEVLGLDEGDVKRWGFHGASYGYIMRRIRELRLLRKRMVICHLGSGSSVLGEQNGEPAYHSMAFTPNEGLMSSTRSSSIDTTIPALYADSKGAAETIRLMNKRSGLLALAGTDDLREVIALAEKGNEKAILAYDMFIDGIVGKIGEFAAKMGGLDAIVFTATISERNSKVRRDILNKLRFIGFRISDESNDFKKVDERKGYARLTKKGSKPAYVIPTNEAAYMTWVAEELLDMENKAA